MDNVLITGATGFIGSHITNVFCGSGIRVGCLVRENSDISSIRDLPVEFRKGDINNLSSLIEAFKGFDCVIHNAAYARDWGQYEDFYKTNVEGTLNVLQACSENGIKNIIMTASISVYGEEDCKAVKDENSPDNSHYRYFADRLFPCKLNYYRDTKALAKKKAVEYAGEHGLNLTILEPVWAYGEREFNTGFFEYMRTASSGIPFLPGSKKNKFHVVYAGDLARAYLLAYRKQMQGINSFIIGTQKAESMDRIYTLFCKEAGVRKPKNLPKFMVYPIGFILELVYTIFKVKTPPLLTRGRVNMFYDNIGFSTGKAESILGFTNEYSLEEGIKKTVKWYKDRKLI